MVCPKCNDAIMVEVTLKSNGERAYLCERCETLWSKSDYETHENGHYFRVHTGGDTIEYILDDAQNEDQEHRNAQYPHLK